MVKVSVVIPIYNMQDYLQECLDSVCVQSLRDIEILCINDGSNDSSMAILRKNAEKDTRIRILDQGQNQGVSAARNRGIRNALGQYVCFIDPDDLYPDQDVLETMYTEAENNRVNICGGSFSDFQGAKVNTEFHDDLAGYVFKQSRLMTYKEYQFDFGYHRFLYNREFLIKNQLFFPPYQRFQDPPFFVKAMITAGKFYALSKVTYQYRVGHQKMPIDWPAEKFYDMLHGHLDNLLISKKYKLAKLHALTVRRVESDYVCFPSVHKMISGDWKVIQLFSAMNEAVDMNLIKEADHTYHSDFYLLKEFREMIEDYGRVRNQLEEMSQKYQEQFDIRSAMERSVSFRTGRVMTYFPRKIRNFFKKRS